MDGLGSSDPERDGGEGGEEMARSKGEDPGQASLLHAESTSAVSVACLSALRSPHFSSSQEALVTVKETSPLAEQSTAKGATNWADEGSLSYRRQKI